MSNDTMTMHRTESISFKVFRDEEITDFFANENRTFNPLIVRNDNDFGRNHVVSSPHFPAPRKTAASAAFRVAASTSVKTPEKRPICIPLKTIPLPECFPLGEFRVKNEEHFDSEALTELTVEREIAETDEQLEKIVALWSSLSAQVKETITALVDVAEKTDVAEV
jgi:hypothetical protein